MDTFIYNKSVTGKNHLGRKAEATILRNLLCQGENIVIYEPPKAGKTSLVQQTLYNMRIEGKSHALAEQSLLGCRRVEDAVCLIAGKVIRTFATTPSEYAAAVREFLPDTHFVFDLEVFQHTDRIVSMNWEMDEEDLRAVLTLPYRISAAKGSQMLIVLLEEFQNIMLCDRGEWFCKVFEQVLKAAGPEWHSSACWIFCGSQFNAMKEIFDVQRYFYRCVERVALKPVENKETLEHIVKGFLSTGKVVDRDLMLGVCNRFKGNLWYINHFCSICDSLSKGYIMEPVLVEALDSLLAIHQPRFIATMNDLTTFQVQLLKAIVDGYTKFSSAEVIRKYGLNSSANVRRLKDALNKKEIVTFDENDDPHILDPLFEYWITTYYFNQKL